MKIYVTELLRRQRKKESTEDIRWIVPTMINRIHNQLVSSLHKVINMNKLIRSGMNAYIESRLTINDPLKNTIMYLEDIVKNFYYLTRLLQSNQTIDPSLIKNGININHSDSISFYESLSGKQDMFPSMVGKVKEMELLELQKYKENFIVDDETRNTDTNLSSDFEAFNLKFSPRTKRRIKRNQQQSSQLKQQNFHEKFYKKLLHGAQLFYSIDDDSSTQYSDVNLISNLLMDYRKSKELHKTFHTLFSEELKLAENRLFEKMKEVKDTRKEQILQNKIDPKTLAEENEEDERIKEFIRSDKIDSKLYKRCEFW